MVSVANVPWLRNSFDGFIVGFRHEGRLYPFTTYTGAKIVHLHYDKTSRFCFFFHYLNPQVPFESPAGRIPVPTPTPRPARLAFITYEPPC